MLLKIYYCTVPGPPTIPEQSSEADTFIFRIYLCVNDLVCFVGSKVSRK